jgi:hypothetical protein
MHGRHTRNGTSTTINTNIDYKWSVNVRESVVSACGFYSSNTCSILLSVWEHKVMKKHTDKKVLEMLTREAEACVDSI